MKYISIDIETTGLDKDKHQIVEIGAVIDELGSDTPIEDLPKFRAVLIHDEMQINAFCANLHRDLWPEILAAQNEKKVGSDTPLEGPPLSWTSYRDPRDAEFALYKWLCLNIIGKKSKPDMQPIKINVAGKNPAGFDIPFIEAQPNWQGLIKFRRRVFDPASHYVRDTDECLPDLQECLNRAGFAKTVSHTAVDDAMDVVRLIRHVRKSTFIHIQGDVVADPDKQIAIYQPYCLRCSKRNMCEVCADDSHEVTDCTDRHISD